ncbi:type II toxin-antitoxin system RelE/ParE family toxin [Enterobacter hormaechei]|uniref:type II toxin-antitoxin system RelE/ParE family toxin n=1 Tax=Enterobacter hormaechei TaxID=158836 RepID=UPI003D0D85AD
MDRERFRAAYAQRTADSESRPRQGLEHLNPPLTGDSSIRVNEKSRLIFKWGETGVEDLYLDPHAYR